MQPQKEIVVDQVKYIVQLYGPTFGFTLYAKLLRLLGQPVVKLIMAMKDKDLATLDPKDLDFDQIGNALESLFSNLKDDELVPLIQEILSQTYNAGTYNKVNDTFETQFLGKYSHVFKLTAKTLGVQYPDFLSGIVKRMSAGKGVQATSPKTEGSNTAKT